MRYQLCGWNIDSEMILPELLPWNGPEQSADITLTLGPVPPLTGEIQLETPFLRVASPTLHLTLPAAGRFAVTDGHRIQIEPAPDADNRTLRLHLLGSVFGLLCLQRGMLPLHGAGLRLRTGVVVILGASGAGKSTLATALIQRGAGLISDDVCVIDPASLHILPAFPRLRLWHDSALALGWQPEEEQRVRPELAKYDLAPAASDFDPTPAPLLGFVLLHRHGDRAQPSRQKLKGMTALQALTGNIFRSRAAQGLGCLPALLATCLELANRLPVYRLGRGEALADLASLADDIMNWFGGG